MSLYQRKNGFWYTKFSIQRRQVHRKLHTKDHNEAKKLEAKMKADLFKAIELGNVYKWLSITLKDLIAKYEKQSEINDKKSRATDKSRFKLIMKVLGPNTKLKDITIDDINTIKVYKFQSI